MADEKFADDTQLGPDERAVRQKVEELGVSKWIAFITSFWYEYSVAWGPTTYGFDFANRTMTYFDDGKQKINTSVSIPPLRYPGGIDVLTISQTWPQSARAVARALSLPITSTTGPSLTSYANKFVYVSSFSVNQRDMFQSMLRVTNTKEADWTIKYEDIRERYEKGRQILQGGDRMGFIQMMYSRVFFDDGKCHYDELLDNDKLGLPVEDLDEFTRVGVERATGDVTGKD